MSVKYYVLNEGSTSRPAKRYGGSRKVSRKGISSELTMERSRFFFQYLVFVIKNLCFSQAAMRQWHMCMGTFP